MDKYKIEKNTVQETLVIPLYGRRLCSRMFPPLFQDESAAELMERIDYDFSELEKQSNSLMQVFGALEVAMRQSDLAWEVRDYLKSHPKAAIINLGCGLDNTGRACDNGSCKIYNIDLPDVIALRNQLLPAGEREQNLALDLNDPVWMDAIDADSADGTVLFAAGVFYYFTTKQVQRLVTSMAERFPGGRLVFDGAGKTAVRLMLKTWVKKEVTRAKHLFREENMSLEEFRRKYPAQTMTLGNGKLFTYRYYRNPKAAAAVVLLTGGIGLSDLFYRLFEWFAGDFSVLTFDYQIQFADNGEFAGAVAELLRLKEKAWLVGQSLGGVVAQVIAFRHPEVVEGLVLSNTCSLAKDMGDEASSHLKKMMEGQKKSKKFLSVLPFSLFKRLMKWTVMKEKTDGFTPQEKAVMEELCGAMLELLTKPYEYHMIDFLCDAENYFGMTEQDFARWDDKVLLILSEDDITFNQACKDSLIAIMPHPTVVTNLTGGHLALMVRLERYAKLVTEYIRERM